MKFILGSRSPRRKAILSSFILDYEAIASNFNEESISTDLSAPEYVQAIAEGKAKSLVHKHPDVPILTADTTVFFDGEFLNKPKNEEEAFHMLRKLSGNEHEVFSCLTLYHDKLTDSIVSSTKVLLRNLSNEQIRSYIKNFSPIDRAGGYGIQDGFGILVEKIEGNFSAVVGLPINALEILLAKIGINIWQKFAV